MATHEQASERLATLDRLATLIADRRLGREGGALVLDVRFHRPLPTELRAELASEALALPTRRGPGLYVPRRLSVDEGFARLELDPVDVRVTRLDLLLAAMSAHGRRLEGPVAALIAGAAAARLRGLHAEGRADGDLAPRHLLLGPTGGVALIAPGLPGTRALLVPVEGKTPRMRRRASELILGEPPTPRSDVHGLGALYYELLSGVPYRADAGAAALRGAARAALPAELPAALPEPRPSLVAFLAAALAPHRQDRPASASELVEGLRAELAQAGSGLADRKEVVELVDSFLASSSTRGVEGLLVEDPTEAAGVPATTVGPNPFLERPSTPEVAPGAPGRSSGWAAILGEEPAASPKLEGTAPDSAGPAEDAPPSVADGRLAIPSPDEQAARPPLPEAAAPRPGLPLPEASAPRPGLPLPEASASRPGGLLPQTSPSPRGVPLPSAPLASLRPSPNGPGAGLAGSVGLPGMGTPAPLGELSGPRRLEAPTLEGAATLPRRTIGLAALTVVALIAGLWLLAWLRGAGEDPVASMEPRVVPRGSLEGTPDTGAPKTVPRPIAPAPKHEPPPKPKGPSLGLVSVMSRPSGAQVMIDGSYVGDTPLVLRHRLESRIYLVQLSAPGYREVEERVRPKEGSLSLMVTLPKR